MSLSLILINFFHSIELSHVENPLERVDKLLKNFQASKELDEKLTLLNNAYTICRSSLNPDSKVYYRASIILTLFADLQKDRLATNGHLEIETVRYMQQILFAALQAYLKGIGANTLELELPLKLPLLPRDLLLEPFTDVTEDFQAADRGALIQLTDRCQFTAHEKNNLSILFCLLSSYNQYLKNLSGPFIINALRLAEAFIPSERLWTFRLYHGIELLEAENSFFLESQKAGLLQWLLDNAKKESDRELVCDKFFTSEIDRLLLIQPSNQEERLAILEEAYALCRPSVHLSPKLSLRASQILIQFALFQFKILKGNTEEKCLLYIHYIQQLLLAALQAFMKGIDADTSSQELPTDLSLSAEELAVKKPYKAVVNSFQTANKDSLIELAESCHLPPQLKLNFVCMFLTFGFLNKTFKILEDPFIANALYMAEALTQEKKPLWEAKFYLLDILKTQNQKSKREVRALSQWLLENAEQTSDRNRLYADIFNVKNELHDSLQDCFSMIKEKISASEFDDLNQIFAGNLSDDKRVRELAVCLCGLKFPNEYRLTPRWFAFVSTRYAAILLKQNDLNNHNKIEQILKLCNEMKHLHENKLHSVYFETNESLWKKYLDHCFIPNLAAVNIKTLLASHFLKMIMEQSKVASKSQVESWWESGFNFVSEAVTSLDKFDETFEGIAEVKQKCNELLDYYHNNKG